MTTLDSRLSKTGPSSGRGCGAITDFKVVTTVQGNPIRNGESVN